MEHTHYFSWFYRRHIEHAWNDAKCIQSWYICFFLALNSKTVWFTHFLFTNLDDWVSILGDPTKFGLGAFSVMYDILFLLQHYVFYRFVYLPWFCSLKLESNSISRFNLLFVDLEIPKSWRELDAIIATHIFASHISTQFNKELYMVATELLHSSVCTACVRRAERYVFSLSVTNVQYTILTQYSRALIYIWFT